MYLESEGIQEGFPNQKGCRRVFLIHLFAAQRPSCFSQVGAAAVLPRC